MANRELARRITEEYGVTVSRELIRVALKRHGYSWKKAKFYGQASNQESKTTSFLQAREVCLKDDRVLVSLDETSFGRHTHPVYGYALKGHALCVRRKPARVTTRSLLAAITTQGHLHTHVIEGSFNTIKFVEALKAFPLPQGSVIMLDNVSFHHSKAVKDYAAEKQLQLLHVPPYSPWFNPVEGVFSIMKRQYYQHASIPAAVSSVSHQHIQAFFKKSLAAVSGP